MSETKSTYQLIQEQSAIDHGVETPSASQVLSTATKHGYGTNVDPSIIRLGMQLGQQMDKIDAELYKVRRTVLTSKRKLAEKQTNLAKSIVAAANSGDRSAFSELEREAKALKKEWADAAMTTDGDYLPGGSKDPRGNIKQIMARIQQAKQGSQQ